MTITGKEGIEYVRLCSIRGRLNLEISGMRFKGRGILTICKEAGFIPKSCRTKKAALAIIEKMIAERRSKR